MSSLAAVAAVALIVIGLTRVALPELHTLVPGHDSHSAVQDGDASP